MCVEGGREGAYHAAILPFNYTNTPLSFVIDYGIVIITPTLNPAYQ